MPTVAEYIDKLIADNSRLKLAIGLLRISGSHEDDPIVRDLSLRISTNSRIITAAGKFLERFSNNTIDSQRGEGRIVRRDHIPGIHERHHDRLCNRKLSESDYWMLVFRNVLIDDFRLPSVTCSLCRGIIDITNADGIPPLMREYMPRCICDTTHYSSGWKTPIKPLPDTTHVYGLYDHIMTAIDKEIQDHSHHD